MVNGGSVSSPNSRASVPSRSISDGHPLLLDALQRVDELLDGEVGGPRRHAVGPLGEAVAGDLDEQHAVGGRHVGDLDPGHSVR